MPGAPATRNEYLKRLQALKTERTSWDTHWYEISQYLLPRNGRFMITDRNKGTRKHNSILDNTGTRSLRVLGAGLMSGATSPARPWFRLATPDPDLMKSDSVKLWLADSTRRMQRVFQVSNTYRALHMMYEELGAFGTSAGVLMDDYDSVIHHYTLTAGEYCITTDYRGRVDGLYRECEKTVGELVKEFGYDNCSATVRNLYDKGTFDAWVPIIHLMEPREIRDVTKRDAKNMPFRSVYFEQGVNEDKLLRESGFKFFRCLAPRWQVGSGDIYGTSPGMEALGDIKQLQHQQLRKAEAIDYKVRPPLQAPSSLLNKPLDRFPGGVTYYDSAPNNGIRSMFEVNLDLNHLLADIQDVRERIRGAFYTDLFLMLANVDRTQMTATEVAERHEEKMLMLGPVLERLHNELLSPMVDITFARMLEAGLLLTPPEELQGQDLNVEFVSILAQAQRAVSTNSVDRFVLNLGQVATMKPGVLDRFDEDKWAEEYADMLGVSPDIIVPDAKVALIREQKAQQMQQAQAAQQAEMMANTANKLAASPTNEQNALTDVMRNLQGYGTGGL